MVNSELDASVHVLDHPLQWKSVIDLADSLSYGTLDPLGDMSCRGSEVGDVSLPSRSPLQRLAGETLMGAGDKEVEGYEASDTSYTKGDALGGSGSGDTDRHIDVFDIVESCCVWRGQSC